MKNYNVKDVDAYIESSVKESQMILKELRKIIKSTIPKVEEKISWGVPFYRYHGTLGGFATYKNHVSFGCGGFDLSKKDREMLEGKGYKTGKKAIQIKFDQKVPSTAIRKLLKAQIKMNEIKKAA